MGDFPLMTKSGTFIVNGAERVVVSQIVRSPGIYYGKEIDPKTDLPIGGLLDLQQVGHGHDLLMPGKVLPQSFAVVLVLGPGPVGRRAAQAHGGCPKGHPPFCRCLSAALGRCWAANLYRYHGRLPQPPGVRQELVEVRAVVRLLQAR